MEMIAFSGLLALSGITSGCFFVLPAGTEVTAGHKLGGETLKFLDLPGTTRQETIATLGEPLSESITTRTLIYEWETTGKWAYAFAMPPVEHVQLPAVHGTATEDAKLWVLLIAYDTNHVVCAHTVRRVRSYDWETVCQEWQQNRDAPVGDGPLGRTNSRAH